MLGSLAKNYRNHALDADDKELLSDLVGFAKAVYFKGNVDNALIDRFGLRGFSKDGIKYIIDAYKKHGPHKTTAEKVAGPSEVFGSIQIAKSSSSGRGNMGYNRKGKRRPHRGTPDDERF